MAFDALTHGPPHMRLLARCGRAESIESEQRELGSLLRAGVDWNELVRAAEYHALTPLLARQLHGELAARCPADRLAHIRDSARAQVAKSFALTAELIEVLAALREAGVPALALKGPVSAALCYGDFGARSFVDLDLLVDPAQVSAAALVLQARGYAPHVPLAPGLLERLVRSSSELLFRHGDGVRLVDLHWALMPRGYSFTPEDGGLFAQRQLVRIATADVPTLGDTATLLFMLLHGMKHDWDGLGWLCDVAGLVRRQPIDWPALLDWSAARGRRRLVDVGLLLAHRLLDALVPDAALHRARADRKAAAIAEQLAQRLLAPAPSTVSPSLLERTVATAYARAMELPRDRLRLLHDVVLRPTAFERQALPLPAALSPLHYLVRPVRLAWKHAPRPWSRR